MSYIYSNPNPVKRKTTDCVVRALCLATNKSWVETYDALDAIAKTMYVMPTSKEAYEQFLSSYPNLNIFHFVNGKKKRYLVKEWKERGVFVGRVANHLVAIHDGNYFDTFDSGNKALYKVWKVK